MNASSGSLFRAGASVRLSAAACSLRRRKIFDAKHDYGEVILYVSSFRTVKDGFSYDLRSIVLIPKDIHQNLIVSSIESLSRAGEAILDRPGYAVSDER